LSDGSAPYPDYAIYQFTQNEPLWRQVEFHAVAYGDGDVHALEQMVRPFPEGTLLEAATAADLERSLEASFEDLQSHMVSSRDWYCGNACAEYSYPTADFSQCITDTCNSREYLLVTGKCEECNDYTVPTEDGKGCKECNMNEIITSDGKCEVCPPPGIVTNQQRTCQTVCASDKVLINGACASCPAYKHPNPTKTECISEQCDGLKRQYLLPTGLCGVCGQYMIPTPGGRACQEPTCTETNQ